MHLGGIQDFAGQLRLRGDLGHVVREQRVGSRGARIDRVQVVIVSVVAELPLVVGIRLVISGQAGELSVLVESALAELVLIPALDQEQAVDLVREAEDRVVGSVQPLAHQGGTDEGLHVACVRNLHGALLAARVSVIGGAFDFDLVLDLHVDFVQLEGVGTDLPGLPVRGLEVTQSDFHEFGFATYRVVDPQESIGTSNCLGDQPEGVGGVGFVQVLTGAGSVERISEVIVLMGI